MSPIATGGTPEGPPPPAPPRPHPVGKDAWKVDTDVKGLAPVNRRAQGGLDAPEPVELLMKNTEFCVRGAQPVTLRAVSVDEMHDKKSTINGGKQ